ncbi:MAG: carboxylating nicotinate-nucleotide diphosphorylase [Sciscionella sp.]
MSTEVSGERFVVGSESERELLAAGLDVAQTVSVIRRALTEDLAGGGDPTTTACVPADVRGVAEFTPRGAGVLAGIPVAMAVLRAVFDAEPEVLVEARDGDTVTPGQPALVVGGPVRILLTAERTVLNFLCHLSGIATHSRAWVDAVAHTPCQIRDSRKTVPGLRSMQKYAVRCGGARNHRMGLWDSVLIKDNHVLAAGSVAAALRAVREQVPGLHCEVEVDTLLELDEALAAGADEVLLDNFGVTECAAAVARRDAVSPQVHLEASGGLTLGVAAGYAESGVDYLAIGALTHSSPALDLGMDLRVDEPSAAALTRR